MGTRHSEYARAFGDWYVEPGWAVDIVLDRFDFAEGLHDPCCGMGTVVDAALARGIAATGADIADRADGRFLVRDFFDDRRQYPNIVSNIPYDVTIAEAIIVHALDHVAEGGRLAVLVADNFRHSQDRWPLFTRHCPELIICLSRRPSCPPGELLLLHGEKIRRGGSIDRLDCVAPRLSRPLPARVAHPGIAADRRRSPRRARLAAMGPAVAAALLAHQGRRRGLRQMLAPRRLEAAGNPNTKGT